MSVLKPMNALQAIGIFYGIVIALFILLSILGAISPILAGILLLGVILYTVYGAIKFRLEADSSIIHKCLELSQSRKTTMIQLLLSMLIFPLYPILGLPLVMLSSIMMAQGKCNKE